MANTKKQTDNEKPDTAADSIGDNRSNFRHELNSLINSYSMENGSGTPDFILANYLASCLYAFDEATKARDDWYGKTDAWTWDSVATQSNATRINQNDTNGSTVSKK